ncbi:hypothetical protein BDU57DRAFT_551429 [Ampelomyces quisqualis]|uniref:Uncharacterized protein n=1 Tax=Ampelomyces quisqualis TaxID=50730 RepID=A0A6A5QCM7_AMPQU|nr:hypothetical protein BDU57DRAFT_551429 [Ampelomyces quisqualis]
MSAPGDDEEASLKSPVITAAHDALYARDNSDSPLLRLPAELRNIIYGYVLGGIDIGRSVSLSEARMLRLRS